jgi:hypothetical protein
MAMDGHAARNAVTSTNRIQAPEEAMTKTSTLLLALSLAPVLGACNRAPAPATTTPATTSNGTGPQTMLGRTVETAMAKARHELETSNLELGGGSEVRVGSGHHFRIGSSTDGSKAQLTPRGDLLVNGKPVAITPQQRALLLDYRREVIGVAETGMAIGVQGADLAGKAVLGTLSGLLHGDVDQAGKGIEAEGKRIETRAKEICTQLPAMLTTQQQLAASLPEFKPFASMTQEDVDDCMKGNGVSVTSADHHEVRDEIREQVRNRIREAVRTPSSAGTTAKTDDAEATPQAQ